MTGITTDGFEIDREIAAPPAVVFEAFTTAAGFAQWFGGAQVAVPAETLDYEAIPGRRWSATMVLPDGNTIDWAGEFLEVVAPERVVFTLTDRPDDPEQLAVTVEFEATQNGTMLHMAQAAPDFSDEQRTATIQGWQTFFDALEQIAQTAEPARLA